MAQTPILISGLPTGLTGVTCDVFQDSDAPLQSSIALTAETNRSTTYAGVVTAAVDGVVQIITKHSNGTPIDDRFSLLADTTTLQIMHELGNLQNAIAASIAARETHSNSQISAA